MVTKIAPDHSFYHKFDAYSTLQFVPGAQKRRGQQISLLKLFVFVNKMELNVPLPSVTPQDWALEIEMIALVETGSYAASAISVATAGFA